MSSYTGRSRKQRGKSPAIGEHILPPVTGTLSYKRQCKNCGARTKNPFMRFCETCRVTLTPEEKRNLYA